MKEKFTALKETPYRPYRDTPKEAERGFAESSEQQMELFQGLWEKGFC